ncbi:MAG: response regulator [Planctomycetota bacterium]|nr:response regulator [Planctomycetota bacterium]
MANLLVVDDDRNLRLLYKEEFEEEGYGVRTAGGGAEALEMVSTRRPDLVILDISMPGLDGIALLERLQTLDRRLPVVINTAYSNYKDNFMTWSAEGYVVKSGDLAPLKEKGG